MKKLLLILLCLPMIGFGQQTYVPDDNFEAYLEAYGMGNGIPNDDYVTTANISSVNKLSMYTLGISDLTGIEDFSALDTLKCDQNELTFLDVSQNNTLIWLSCTYNQISTLQLSSNIVRVDCYFNDLTLLDISQCPYLSDLRCGFNKLTHLDLSTNCNLSVLACSDNLFAEIDISNCANIVALFCSNNELTTLNVSNGINQYFGWSCGLPFYCNNNPNLTCITVDDTVWSSANWLLDSNQIDAEHYFSHNCSEPTHIYEQNTTKELLKVTDILARETKGTKNEVLFYIYDDGTIERRIVIE